MTYLDDVYGYIPIIYIINYPIIPTANAPALIKAYHFSAPVWTRAFGQCEGDG